MDGKVYTGAAVIHENLAVTESLLDGTAEVPNVRKLIALEVFCSHLQCTFLPIAGRDEQAHRQSCLQLPSTSGTWEKWSTAMYLAEKKTAA